MKKQIAYIGIKSLPSKAGADRVVEAIVRGLDARHYQATVYCSRRVVDRETRIPGVRLILLPTIPGKYMHATSLFIFAAIHALLVGKYDLVHVHNVEACFVLPLLRLRYKVISTSHGAAQARDKWNRIAKLIIGLMEYPYVKFSNCCTCVSSTLTSHYLQQYRRDVRYIPNGVSDESPVDGTTATELLAQYNVRPGNYILFVAGRVIPTKGCHHLLQAFGQLEEDIDLIIVGDASQIPKYERYLHSLADERVHFIPFISEKRVLFGLYSFAHLFVFPSAVEAMSMVLLEVSALGKPIICSNLPENVSVLSKNAIYFESGNAIDLNRKLCWALQHHEEMQVLAANAQERVQQHFRWDVIIQEYQSIYDAIHARQTGFDREHVRNVPNY